MKVVDANVLLYAVNQDAHRHDEARAWLDHALSGGDTVAFSWQVLLAFIRIATHPGLFSTPLDRDQALDVVERWTGAPTAVVLSPAPDHARLLRQVLAHAEGAGNLVNDAHLAALALAHRATVVTYDDDFDRFEGLRWTRPTT